MRDLSIPLNIPADFLVHTLRYDKLNEPDNPPEDDGYYDDGGDGVYYEDGDGEGYDGDFEPVNAAPTKSSYTLEDPLDLVRSSPTPTYNPYISYGTPAPTYHPQAKNSFGDLLIDLVKAPFILLHGTIMSLKERKKEDLELYLRNLGRISLTISIVYSALYIFGWNALILPTVSTGLVALATFFGTRLLQWRLGYIGNHQDQENSLETPEFSSQSDESPTDDFDGDEDIVYDDEDAVYDDEDVVYDEDDEGVYEEEFDDEFEDEYIEEEIEEDENPYVNSSNGSSAYAERPVKIPKNFHYKPEYIAGDLRVKLLKDVGSISNEEFQNILLTCYEANKRKRQYFPEYPTKAQIFDSFSEYFFSNTPEFSEWTWIPPRGVVANNLAYLIYEGMRDIFNTLTYTDDRFRIMEMRENKLMYHVTAICPKKVRPKELTANVGLIGTQFKRNEDDNATLVQVIPLGVSKYTFKIMKPVKEIVSFGDVINFKRPDGSVDVYKSMTTKNRLPFIPGLINNETPAVIDLVKEQHFAVFGPPGGGKSWLIYFLLMNMVTGSTPSEVSFVIFDRKKAPTFRTFSRFPHVVKYVTEMNEFLDVMKALYDEMQLRKEILNDLGMEKWESFHERYKDDPKQLREMPFLYIIIDELPATLEAMKQESQEKLYNPFKALMSDIAREGRSEGIKLGVIGQRPTNANIPRDVIELCSMKIAFKSSENELKKINMDALGLVMTNEPGQAIIQSIQTGDKSLSIRTMGTGGGTDDQIMDLLRIMALDWQMRNPYLPSFSTLERYDERKKVQQQVIEDFETGRMFGSSLLEGLDVTQKIKKMRGQAEDERATASKPAGKTLQSTTATITYGNSSLGTSQKPPSKPKQISWEDDEVYEDDDIVYDDDEEIFEDDEEFIEEDDEVYEEDEEIYEEEIIEEHPRPNPKSNPVTSGSTSQSSPMSSPQAAKNRFFSHPLSRRNGSKPSEESTNTRRIIHKVVETPNPVPTASEASQMRVEEYVRACGGRVQVSVLDKIYTKKEIDRALNEPTIVRSGDYYIV